MDPVLFGAIAQTLVVDKGGNLWVPESGLCFGSSPQCGGSVGILPSTSTTKPTYNVSTNTSIQSTIASGTAAVSATSNSAPYAAALDASGNAWVTNFGGGTSGWSGTKGFVKVSLSGGPPVTTITQGTAVTSGMTAPKGAEVDGANYLWIADSTGNHEFNLTPSTPAEVSESGGYVPCYLGYQGTATTCTSGSIDTVSYKTISVDSTGSVWYLVPTSTSNSTTTQQGLAIEMIGTASPTWPLRAQVSFGLLAGCTTALNNTTHVCN
jgi:hypothetical protein